MGDGIEPPSQKRFPWRFSNWVGVVAHFQLYQKDKQQRGIELHWTSEIGRHSMMAHTKSSRLLICCVTFATPSLWLYWHHKFTFFFILFFSFFKKFFQRKRKKCQAVDSLFLLADCSWLCFTFQAAREIDKNDDPLSFCYRQSMHLTEKRAHFELVISFTGPAVIAMYL